MTRKLKPTGPTFREYIETYIAERELCKDYSTAMRERCHRFIRWCGHEILVSGLTCNQLNNYFTELEESELQPQTIKGHRSAIRAVWQAAFMDELVDEPPLRLKPIRCSLPVPEAYTLEEIRKLVEAAGKIKGFAPNGVKWSDLWCGLILGAFSTGLRRGDMLRIQRAKIAEDGLIVIRQHKTGFDVCVRFSEESLACIRRIETEDGRAFPWPYHENNFVPAWRRIRKAAGVNRGEFRWLRRSAASYAEKQQPGLGTRMLGHRDPRLVVRHYADPTISAADPVTLPAIGGVA